ncbi:MAG: RT0821/Lpp0805 family surface protein [Geminicoccaceae bacterium]
MQSLPRLAAMALVALALVGCANSDLGPKQTVGTLVGAGTGALIGTQFGRGRGQLVATSVGTLLGAYLGNEAGKSLDRADRVYASRAEYEALEYTPSGSPTPWRNPDTGHYGSVTPVETYETAGGTYCREFQHQAQIGGRTRDVHGTACRTPDGQWQAVR